MPPKSITRSPRTYRSELRQQQAEATRTRILEAAAKLFAADGYARTTLAKIAAAAGVSAETVQGQGPKAALMIAAIEHTAVGVAGEENILNLESSHTLLAIDDPQRALDFACSAQTALHGRTTPLDLALAGGADIDADLKQFRHELIVSITRQNRRILEVFRDRGWVRTDIPFDEVVETASVLASDDTYQRMTLHDGWSVDAYRSWLRRMLAETVFSL